MSRLRSNKVVNQAGTGAPELTYGAVVPGTGTISGAGGINVTGIVTAASFSGDGSALSGIDASTLKDGSNTKVQATATGATVTGDITATNATFSGNLTVNGTTTTIDTAVTSVDSLAVDGNVGIGTTNPTQLLHLSKSSASQILLERTGSNPSQIAIKNEGELLEISQNTDGIILKTGSSPTERLRVTSTGKLEVYKGTSATGKTSGSEAFTVGNGAGNKRFSVYPDGTAVIGGQGTIANNNILLQNDGEAVFGGTGSIKVPVGTTGQRPGSAAAGMFRYNSTEGKFEGYTTEWGEIGGGGGITTEASVASGAVVTLDLTAAQDHKVTATGICTITCTGGTEAESHTVRIINSGSATIGFSTYFLFPSGSTPSLPSADGSINLISFTVNRVGAAGTQLLAGASVNFS
jgi:hypothetical protein